MTKPRIGILGGMGPAATILLQQRVLNAVAAKSDADHIPLLIDMNPQVPSRIDYLIHKRGENPGPVLAHMARCLEASDIDALAMPCCTAHHFAKDITQAVSAKFLNMIELTAKSIANSVAENAIVGILASPANIKTQLFEKALRPYGLTAQFPKDIDKLLVTIETIKAVGKSPQTLADVQSIITDMVTSGVDGFIIGCTEFSLMSPQLTAPVPLIDALDELTSEIVNLSDTGTSPKKRFSKH